ncbi:asic-1 [Pristionchus pacificus]|uniref:Asic-1 n=1 Tax=Pristionchus pacificus TaxID=54126 RepID=A0A2A6CCT1_PRIPA|nr:asic-1 [Pristionchus pacificus]|eukprot:PDM75898.1 asic-1 [Pristionchus pacificus]
MFHRIVNSLGEDFNDFAKHTRTNDDSAHGIPRAYDSKGKRRLLWLALFFLCLILFGQQAYFILERFRSKPIIVSVEIKFERIAFPSVTVCNLNPYKFSLAKGTSGVGDTLKAFDDAVIKNTGEGRSKREVNKIEDGLIGSIKRICPLEINGGKNECICAFSTSSGEIFNCRPSIEWNCIPCENCQITGLCTPSSNVSYASICDCIDDYCLRNIDEIQVTLDSPSLSLRDCPFPSSSECLCTRKGECHPREEWSLSHCGKCDWRGECIHTLHPQDECLCRGHHCYSVSSSHFVTKHSLRVVRQSKKNLEKTMSRYEALMAVHSHCKCGQFECIGSMDRNPLPSSDLCLCFYNKNTNSLWPCYQSEKWKERKCMACSTMGNCPYSSSMVGKESCLCIDDIKGMTDPIALKTKAMENVMFSVQGMNSTAKEALSYSKKEFITKCSFNGRECSIDNDFSIHSDPVYGNCFTFNYDKDENMTSERAGPQYGLRFQVFVNVTDYLPTTEAAGVRLTVHSPDEQPFPDTLGFSAPTGFVSSFGIRLKHMTRLPSPYGDCTRDGKDEHFIYPNKNYSTEACQRSCLQRFLIDRCACGDPRYPPHIKPNCPVDDPEKRDCLAKGIKNAIREMASTVDCVCPQPCRQLVYSVSYSAARWPTLSSMTHSTDCPLGLTHHLCLEYFREQGAMIEVFFEQLNYESLVETEAYGIPNLLSDFGGQLGLWMGVSVITISEVAILILDIFMSILCCGRTTARKMSSRQRSMRGSFKNSEYILNRSSVHDNHNLPFPNDEKKNPSGGKRPPSATFI